VDTYRTTEQPSFALLNGQIHPIRMPTNCEPRANAPARFAADEHPPDGRMQPRLAEHLRLRSYPRMSKRPRDPPDTEAVRQPFPDNKSGSSLQGVTRLGGRTPFHRRPHSQTGGPKRASPV